MVELDIHAGGDLLFTWAAPGGGFASSPDPADVPETSRAHVLIQPLGMAAPAASAAPDDGLVLVADLRGAAAGSKVKARRVERARFEADAMASAAAVPAPPTGPGGTGTPGTGALPTGARTVTMYSASWCGVCANARAYFKSNAVPYVEKDVEKDPGARDELLAKTRAAGMAYKGGVPVLDIGGRLMVGFDARAVDGALKAAGIKG